VAQNEYGRDLWDSLQAGFTLPGTWYADPLIFAAEKEKIFGRLWQYACRQDFVAQPGQYYVYRAGDVPIVIVREDDGELRAFVNVCRHRACEVVLDGHGQRKSLQCQYHGWTYGLDGRLQAAPQSKEDPTFSTDDWKLHPVSVAQFGPFVFVNPNPEAKPLADQLGVLPALIESRTGLDLGSLKYRGQRDYDIAANWKVLVENYNECYHCPMLHPDWVKTVYVKEFTLTTRDYVQTQDVPPREGYELVRPESRERWVETGTYSYVFPNFILNIFPGPGNVFMRKLTPVDAQRTRVEYELFCTDDVTPEEEKDVWSMPIQIFEEDIPIVESVQRGINSGTFDRGKLLLPRQENGPHHFMKLVYLALTDELLDDPSRANEGPDGTIPLDEPLSDHLARIKSRARAR
jgi:choline monooxygenase